MKKKNKHYVYNVQIKANNTLFTLGGKQMNNTENLLTLMKQVLSKLDETNQRLETLEAHEDQRRLEEENYLLAIRSAIQNDNIMG